jgi:hypothetical protein
LVFFQTDLFEGVFPEGSFFFCLCLEAQMFRIFSWLGVIASETAGRSRESSNFSFFVWFITLAPFLQVLSLVDFLPASYEV